jgi:hypothetical protein
MTEPPTPESMAPVAARYGREMKFESLPELVNEYGLRFPGFR